MEWPLMQDRRFLDDRMSIHLDLVRGGAALVVLTGHAGQIGLFGSAWPFDDTLQHSAVVVFFVLSGLMIHQSASRVDMTIARFARNRIARIMPVGLFSIIFSTSLILLNICNDSSISCKTRLFDISIFTIIAPILFISERMNGIGNAINPPFWSLCYEFWFYAIFATFYFIKGWMRVILLYLVIKVADLLVILLFPRWLIGVAIGIHGSELKIQYPRTIIVSALTGFVICQWSGLPHVMVQLLRRYGLDLTQLRFSAYFLTDIAGAACVACAIVALRQISVDPSPFKIIARRYAGISFTLYLTHWPLLLALQSYLGEMPAGVKMLSAFIIPIGFARLLAPLLEGLLPRLLRGRRREIPFHMQ